jgi:hypothetical protein
MTVKIAILVKSHENTVSHAKWKDATLEEIGVAITHLELKKKALLDLFEKGTTHIKKDESKK